MGISSSVRYFRRLLKAIVEKKYDSHDEEAAKDSLAPLAKREPTLAFEHFEPPTRKKPNQKLG